MEIMEERYYTDDKNTLILLSLLKEHGIRKVIASPGTTNIALVASMQYDNWFQVYSSVDERSAAYMACGMAEASGEPVIITCTGATASRNYFPGLTEAYYRKLPVLAITGSHGEDLVGHLHAQTLDRSVAPRDTVIYSTAIRNNDSSWKVTVEVNKALLELSRNGGGPVHIDLESAAYGTFTTKELPHVRVIRRYYQGNEFPKLEGKRVVIFIGEHGQFDEKTTQAIERFCEIYNSLVLVDHTSGYYGKYALNFSLIAGQGVGNNDVLRPDVLIHLGGVSGDSYTSYGLISKETWRVCVDGEIKDRFSNMSCVFEMTEDAFFNSYQSGDTKEMTLYEGQKALYDSITLNIPELPFGNIWIAQQLHDKLPQNSVVFLSILNSLRSWDFFAVDKSIKTHCNVGGFGIDGTLSTLLGAALINPQQLHFCITGDLSFFYDINCLGNRHFTSNIRILLINNGKGTEFTNYDHPGAKWGEKANDYIAAEGHFGKKSKNLVKHFAEDLGFMYKCACSKEEFLGNISGFISTEMYSQPFIFEVFTDSGDESEALHIIRSILLNNQTMADKITRTAKRIIKKIIK